MLLLFFLVKAMFSFKFGKESNDKNEKVTEDSEVEYEYVDYDAPDVDPNEEIYYNPPPFRADEM